MTLPTIPASQAMALTNGQKRALENLYAALASDNVDLVDHALIENWDDIPLGPGQQPGRDGIKPVFRMFRTAFPDLALTIENIVAEADRAAVRLRMTGTHDGPLMGIAPTGKAIDIVIHEFHEFTGDRLSRTWHLEDLLGMFAQIGTWPDFGTGDA
ncbi:ester cyclase [Thalassospira mesophila]|uniref:Ester cyclase n=1 Tax=Thalassospira mesophila TaxID=1293891 RepID=A0A1Y2KZQ5_9PROT|nr:ester cyclase [Thalassospira mesophila]OSQ36790.1 ester cyclase [Thalassospira mesophila]